MVCIVSRFFLYKQQTNQCGRSLQSPESGNAGYNAPPFVSGNLEFSMVVAGFIFSTPAVIC
jgi:hypothetical protein